MRTIACLAAFALCALLVSAPALAKPSASALDGTTWKVDVEPDPMAKEKGEKEFHENVTFAEGKVSMSECIKAGFQPSPYSAAKAGDDKWEFRTDQQSDDQGSTVWTALIEGKEMKGKMVWTKKDGSILTYKVHGEKAD